VLVGAGHKTRHVRSWPEAVEILLAGLCHTVLLAPDLPGLVPEALEGALLRSGLHRPRVFLYGTASPVELAVQATVLEVDGCLSELAGPDRLLTLVSVPWMEPHVTPPPNTSARR